jgi:hypothetical protein
MYVILNTTNGVVLLKVISRYLESLTIWNFFYHVVSLDRNWHLELKVNITYFQIVINIEYHEQCNKFTCIIAEG